MATDPNRQTDDREDRAGTTPYGPHRGQVDEAAGGADSSPLDNVESERRPQAARDRRPPEAPRPSNADPHQP